jgi:autophagy-related protein 5
MEATTRSIPETLWNLQVPLCVTHSSQPDAPAFFTLVPRFGYLALLLPRLSTYFGTDCSSFHHEQIQLRNLPVGLLVDLYQPDLPWRLEVADGPQWDISDTFMNSAKEVRKVKATAPFGHLEKFLVCI